VVVIIQTAPATPGNASAGSVSGGKCTCSENPPLPSGQYIACTVVTHRLASSTWRTYCSPSLPKGTRSICPERTVTQSPCAVCANSRWRASKCNDCTRLPDSAGKRIESCTSKRWPSKRAKPSWVANHRKPSASMRAELALLTGNPSVDP
jgi:hypothetical protein